MLVAAARPDVGDHVELYAHGLQRVRELRRPAHHPDSPLGRVQGCHHRPVSSVGCWGRSKF